MRFLGVALVLAFGAAVLATPTGAGAGAPDGTAAAGTGSGWHASYDVLVRGDGGWRAPRADDGIPEHWEWWTAPASTLDSSGSVVATLAYHQAAWRPGANWTDQTTTHVDGAGRLVRQDALSFGPLPWVGSDLSYNVGTSSINYIGTQVDTAQTAQSTTFGAGTLPCGHAAVATPDALRLSGSCAAWPGGAPTTLRLARAGQDSILGHDAVRYGSGQVVAWIAHDLPGPPVPLRIETGRVRLDLVGLAVSEAAADAMPPPAVPPPAAWTLAQPQPWGLDESGAPALPGAFSARSAYDAALHLAWPQPLSAFLLQHPRARPFNEMGSSWVDGDHLVQRWEFVVADDAASWQGAVTRETDSGVSDVTAQGRSMGPDLVARQPGLPPLSALPAALPTVGSLVERWSAWTGEPPEGGTFWGFSVRCPAADGASEPAASCDAGEAVVRFTAGREEWRFPSQRPDPVDDSPQRIEGTTSRLVLGLDGAPAEMSSSDWRTQRPAILGRAETFGPGAVAPAPRLLGFRDATVAAAGVAGAGLVLLVALRGVPFGVALYARIRTEALPEHPTRATILDLVATTPGLRYSDLLALLGCGKGTLEHHLRMLEAGGHVVLVKSNGLATYFRTRQAAAGHAAAWLRSTTARRILGLLAEGPRRAAEVHELAACGRSTAHHHLVRIERAGLVRRDGPLAAITPAGLQAWADVRAVPQPA